MFRVMLCILCCSSLYSMKVLLFVVLLLVLLVVLVIMMGVLMFLGSEVSVVFSVVGRGSWVVLVCLCRL